MPTRRHKTCACHAQPYPKRRHGRPTYKSPFAYPHNAPIILLLHSHNYPTARNVLLARVRSKRLDATLSLFWITRTTTIEAKSDPRLPYIDREKSEGSTCVLFEYIYVVVVWQESKCGSLGAWAGRVCLCLPCLNPFTFSRRGRAGNVERETWHSLDWTGTANKAALMKHCSVLKKYLLWRHRLK